MDGYRVTPTEAAPIDILAGLNALRQRLLDVSNDNRLLNYRHTTKPCLQIVDELPDELFQRLNDGGKLTFVPVPAPNPKNIFSTILDRPLRPQEKKTFQIRKLTVANQPPKNMPASSALAPPTSSQSLTKASQASIGIRTAKYRPLLRG